MWSRRNPDGLRVVLARRVPSMKPGSKAPCDGFLVKAENLHAEDAWAQGLDPRRAPYLFVDGELLAERAGAERVSRVVLRALFPEVVPR